jgi:hypothetical protein
MPTTITMSGPGTATLIDDTATAVAAQTAALTSAMALQTAQLVRIQGTLAGLVAATGALADCAQASSKAISDLNSAVGGMTTAMHDSAATQQIAAASQVKKNEFDMAVTKQGLAKNGEEEPPQPTLKEQIKSAVKDGLEMHSATKASGFITKKIEDAITDIKSWITSSELYQDVTAWLKKQKDAVLAAFSSKSPSTVARNAAASAGVPPPV